MTDSEPAEEPPEEEPPIGEDLEEVVESLDPDHELPLPQGLTEDPDGHLYMFGIPLEKYRKLSPAKALEAAESWRNIQTMGPPPEERVFDLPRSDYDKLKPEQRLELQKRHELAQIEEPVAGMSALSFHLLSTDQQRKALEDHEKTLKTQSDNGKAISDNERAQSKHKTIRWVFASTAAVACTWLLYKASSNLQSYAPEAGEIPEQTALQPPPPSLEGGPGGG